MARFPDNDYVFKVVMVGDKAVGKSCLARRFATGSFTDTSTSTVGAAFYSRIVEIEGKVVKLQIWDTAGQEQYRAVVPLYYRLANAVIVVYDIANELSFRNVPEWLRHVSTYVDEHVERVLLGNKCDRGCERQVNYRSGLLLADAAGVPFFETSAVEGTNVQAAFRTLLRSLKRRADYAEEEMRSLVECALELDPFAENVRMCC